MKRENVDEDMKKMKADIQKKGEEIEELKKTVEELSAKIRGKEETEETNELGDMIGEVSNLLESSFNIFGISSRGQGTTGRSGGLSELINNLARLAEKSESFQKQFDIDGKKGVIDYHIRSGPLKRPTAKRRGIYTMKPRASALKPSRERVEPPRESFAPAKVEPIKEKEPIVDIFEDEDKVTVMSELPGVTENDIDWDVEEDTLTIRASTSERKYYKEIVLPTPVEKKGAESTYRNGILQIKLRKTPEEGAEKT